MMPDLIKSVTISGGAVMLANTAGSPVLVLITMSVIILTCSVVMAHYLIKCHRENARRKKLKKLEAARGRVDASDPR